MKKVSVIGLRGHAERLIERIESHEKAELSYIYLNREDSHPKVTKDFNNLLKSDGIIISSPTQTHKEYLSKLKDYEGHIFCEKPITLDPNILNSLKGSKLSSKLFVNYCFEFSPVGSFLYELVTSNELGKLSNISMQTGHNGAYKFNDDDWRFGSYGGILNTVLSHFICYLYKINASLEITNMTQLSQTNKGNDTTAISGFMDNNTLIYIFGSWASHPFFNIQFNFEKGGVSWDGKQLNVDPYRDDIPEYLKKITIQENFNMSLDLSLDCFIDGMYKNQQDRDFLSRSLKTEELLISFNKK